MSLEAIDAIAQAEEQAKQRKQEAALANKKMIADAEAQGKKLVDEAVKKAQSELEKKSLEQNEAARSEAVELAKNTENRKAAMLVKADGRADQAIGLVVERIVNS